MELVCEDYLPAFKEFFGRVFAGAENVGRFGKRFNIVVKILAFAVNTLVSRL